MKLQTKHCFMTSFSLDDILVWCVFFFVFEFVQFQGYKLIYRFKRKKRGTLQKMEISVIRRWKVGGSFSCQHDHLWSVHTNTSRECWGHFEPSVRAEDILKLVHAWGLALDIRGVYLSGCAWPTLQTDAGILHILRNTCQVNARCNAHMNGILLSFRCLRERRYVFLLQSSRNVLRTMKLPPREPIMTEFPLLLWNYSFLISFALLIKVIFSSETKKLLLPTSPTMNPNAVGHQPCLFLDDDRCYSSTEEPRVEEEDR